MGFNFTKIYFTEGCKLVYTQEDDEDWDPNGYELFKDCSSLEEVHFLYSPVKWCDHTRMFQGCSNLTVIEGMLDNGRLIFGQVDTGKTDEKGNKIYIGEGNDQYNSYREMFSKCSKIMINHITFPTKLQHSNGYSCYRMLQECKSLGVTSIKEGSEEKCFIIDGLENVYG